MRGLGTPRRAIPAAEVGGGGCAVQDDNGCPVPCLLCGLLFTMGRFRCWRDGVGSGGIALAISGLYVYLCPPSLAAFRPARGVTDTLRPGRCAPTCVPPGTRTGHL